MTLDRMIAMCEQQDIPYYEISFTFEEGDLIEGVVEVCLN